MDRPPARLLQKRLKCAAGVTEAAAQDACEDAIKESGFNIATRSEHCVVLLPRPSMSWARCLAPGHSQSPSQEPGAGRGATVEFVPDGAEGGRLLVCVTAARAGKGKAFVSEFRSRLKVAAHRARLAGIGAGYEARREQELAEKGLLRDSTVYYHVSRLLCSRRTAAGVAAADFLRDFGARYDPGALHEEPLPSPGSGRTPPMAECMVAVRQLSKALQDSWGDVATTEVVGPAPATPSDARLRACVERCLFTRLGPALWNVYSGEHEPEDARFAESAGGLRAQSDAQLLKSLEVRETLHGVAVAARPCGKGDLAAEDTITEATRSTATGSEDEAQGAGVAAEEEVDSRSGEHADDDLGCGPLRPSPGASAAGRSVYRRAAAALSRVQDMLVVGHGGTPREALEALALAQLEMRTCALEASGGQVELSSMEDLLPVFIFVLIRSSLTQPFACARLLADVLTPEERLNNEGKAVQLLESAARYVADEWDGGPSDGL